MQENSKITEIHKVKGNLKYLIETLKDLEKEKNILNEAQDMLSPEQWEIQFAEVKQKIFTLSKRLADFESNVDLIDLSRELKRRSKKRRQQQRRNEVLKATKKKEREERQNRHRQIDEWNRKKEAAIVELKRNSEIVKTSQVILSGVNRKINDATKYLKTLTSLKTLRRLRRNLQQKSILGEGRFEGKIDKLIAVWEDALEEYKTEKSVLEKEMKCKSQPLQVEWGSVLFGDKSKKQDEFENDPSWTQLLERRHSWDSHIVPDGLTHGSSIPIGWVVPPENPSPTWAQYRIDASIE